MKNYLFSILIFLMIPFNLLSQKQDYAIISINRNQGIEVLRVLDDIELLSWENLELKRLLIVRQKQLKLNDVALIQYKRTSNLQDKEILGLNKIVMNYKDDYADLNVAFEKKKRQSQRKTWIIVGVGVLGLIIGVAITK